MDISGIINWVTTNFNTVAELAAWIIAGSSIIVKFAPWLPDNHVFKIVLRILGKIALNRTSPNA